MPPLVGRAVVTGANSGLGHVTARHRGRGPARQRSAGCRRGVHPARPRRPRLRQGLRARFPVRPARSARRQRGRDGLNSERRYRRWVAYARSKTANLLFTHEPERRPAGHGADVVAAAAHPGYAATNLQEAGPRMAGRRFVERFMAVGNRFFAQSAEGGALPTLYAATAPGVPPDSFTGPSLAGLRGSPVAYEELRG